MNRQDFGRGRPARAIAISASARTPRQWTAVKLALAVAAAAQGAWLVHLMASFLAN